MNVSLYQAASALNAMDRWQETIAENLASTAAPGFKKKEFFHTTIDAAMNQKGVVGLGTNFSAGEMRLTNVKTDVAIDGKGFFEIQMPDGSLSYTRDGEFHVDSQGQLVTKQGFKVMGDGGPITLDLNNYTDLTVSASGEVSQGIDLKGRLRIVEFGNTNALKRLNGTYFTAEDPAANPGPATASSLRQGALESANLSSSTEMANLMTVMRIFEANQRMAQIQDERIGRTIAELGSNT